ncbi:MAG: fibronectin type III domain-containing protein [Deltaproteobacteria bacterium]|nr:fibronectin type III domain-containing protein [Deltaproteobacteria bacterium]
MASRSSPSAFPGAPADLVAVAIGGFEVILAWTECENGTLGFHVERAVCHSPCKSFLQIGKVGFHVAAFRDGSVTPRTTYRYRVHAWNALGESPSSNVAEVTTPDTEPSADQG